MKLKERINILSKLKPILLDIVSKKEWDSYENGISKTEYESLKESVYKAKIHNQWFTEENVYEAFLGLSSWLDKKELSSWVQNYNYASIPKRVAVIMAGNIPLVGFHDLISVFLSGHKVIAKLSSTDNILIPALVEIMSIFNEKVNYWIEFTEKKLPHFDAVIATGSDNSALYFQSYFGKYPHIIRKNRTSIAILNGNETKEELKKLGKDIFSYYGLGCRNVSKIFIPKGYNINQFFEAIFDYGDIINHNKYANNYDYNKAVYLMNLVKILDNNFLILKEDDSLHSPLGVLFYQTYESKKDLNNFLELNKDNIQAIVGKYYIPFGQAQCPALNDYADGVDTMAFLENL